MPPVSQRCPSLHIESMLPTFSHHSPYAIVRRKLKLELAIPQLSSLCMSVVPGTVTYLCTSCSSSSTLYIIVEYLMLVDGGFLNSLLPMNSIPSTSDHLFWNSILESFEYLETYSHQCQVISPSTVLRIHQCPLIDGFLQVFYLSTYIHTCYIALCILIPIFIING